MKKTFLSLLLLIVATTMNAQSLLLGDTDQNGTLEIADVTKSVNMIVGNEAQGVLDLAGMAYKVDNSAIVGIWYLGMDVAFVFNADGTTNYADAATYEFRPLLGSIILYDEEGKAFKLLSVAKITAEDLVLADEGTLLTYSSTLPDIHDYVDLGLPSGTLWATCNIGAENPTDYGDYFAWGETMAKDNYTWETYQFCSGSSSTLTKYCGDSEYGNNGFADNLTELLPEDDAAYVNWGPYWRMPTEEQQEELCSQCTWTWETRSGKNGYKAVGPNGNSLFLPAAGYRQYGGLYSVDNKGYYWSRTLGVGWPNCASDLYFRSGYMTGSSDYRINGNPVRPVRASQ